MNKKDTATFATLSALAAHLGHGWANYTDHAAGAKNIAEAFAKIAAAMDAEEESIREAGYGWHADRGIRPSLDHVSASGRYVWDVKNGAVIVRIMRPGNVEAAFVSFGRLTNLRVDTFACEARHAWAIMKVLEAVKPEHFASMIADGVLPWLRGEVVDEIRDGLAEGRANPDTTAEAWDERWGAYAKAVAAEVALRDAIVGNMKRRSA